MKLTDFDKKPIENAQRALKEHYGTNLDVSKLSYAQARTMLTKVRGLIDESKSKKTFYESQNNPTYLKLVFMEQALSKYFKQLSYNRPKIVVENEEVEKSQVVLAAQDMVEEVRKMIEQVSDMLVKELPALVDSIESEIGVNESTTFNQQVSEALTSIQSTLTEGENSLKSALGAITGQGGGIADMNTPEPATGDETADLSGSEELPGGGEEDFDADIEEPVAPEEPEEPLTGVGREKR